MTSGDLEAVALIQGSCPEAAQWDPAGYLHHESWVAEIGVAAAGFLVLRQTAPGEAELLNLAVSPDARRRGVARALLSRLPAGPVSIFLEVRESNVIAQRLYESAGFRVISRRPEYYQAPSEAAIVMLRQKC